MQGVLRMAVLAGFVVGGAAAVPAAAAEGDAALAIAPGGMWGTTSYQLGSGSAGRLGEAAFDQTRSELRFPLDVVMMNLRGELRPREISRRLVLSAEIARSLTRHAGEMVDQDWGVFHAHDPGNAHYQSSSLDVYSTSEAYLTSWHADLGASWRIAEEPGWYLGAGGGLLYRYFDYSIRDVDQWYPSWQQYFQRQQRHDIVEGEVLTYEVQYFAPYAEGTVGFRAGKTFTLEARLGFAPWVKYRDEDYHTLRALRLEGEGTGQALRCAISGRWRIASHWYGALTVAYLYIDARGEQHQVRVAETGEGPAADLGTIDQIVRLEEGTAWASLGYAF